MWRHDQNPWGPERESQLGALTSQSPKLALPTRFRTTTRYIRLQWLGNNGSSASFDLITRQDGHRKFFSLSMNWRISAMYPSFFFSSSFFSSLFWSFFPIVLLIILLMILVIICIIIHHFFRLRWRWCNTQQSPSKKLGEHGYKYIPVGSTPKNIHILKRLNLMTLNVGDSFLRVKDRPCQVKIEDNDLAAALVAAVLGILRA